MTNSPDKPEDHQRQQVNDFLASSGGQWTLRIVVALFVIIGLWTVFS